MNIFRGCGHNCIYCDGRAEKYNVGGEFGVDISVKTNACELLEKEIDPARHRKPLDRGFFFFGGGVGDAYQPAEEKYSLARRILQIIHEHGFPVHVLTKSTLVSRDMDMLKQINAKTRAMVSMSFSSVDRDLSAFLEPGVSEPRLRLQALASFKNQGIPTGMFLMPVVPGLSDTEKKITESVAAAKEAGLDFVIFGGLTLKEGRQKDFFMERLATRYPDTAVKYPVIFHGNKYGSTLPAYYNKIAARFAQAALKFRMPVRIPRKFWEDMVSPLDKLCIMFEHMDYMAMLGGPKSGGPRSPYGYASYMLSKVKNAVDRVDAADFAGIPSFSATVQEAAREIAETGTCGLYEELVFRYSR